ncbi:MAG: hypothetical protein H6752_04720 [Candidatus Omnitrophica bacterium]|nr:hypothetical protein [Candidatus Omnitrophota bacterium]
MTDGWYTSVDPQESLTQGDLIFECPVASWVQDISESWQGEDGDELARRVEIFKDDVVVLSQACDLEHGKITNVILCPHQSIEDFKNDAWIPWMREKGQNPSEKAWRKYCADIADGFIWNLAILNRIDESGFECKSHRVVNFHDVYSLPREFVETLLSEERVTRVRLLAPYREHLSQAFARFFMRVGLPVPLEKNW